MRVATWNVNSVRARCERLLAWLEAHRPDVVCLQEIKCLDEQFPREPVEDLGYNIETFGQKTYNGVAILARTRIEDVVRGMPGDDESSQRRVIAATVGDVRYINAYVVNGEKVGSEKYAYKLEWMARLADYAHGVAREYEATVLTGDFNVTFDDRDVHDPEAWREKILCSTPERDALRRIQGEYYRDAMRKFTEEKGAYTWWDFRTGAFRGDRGLRIDHFLVTPAAHERAREFFVDREERAGEKPSDHAPVFLALD